METYNSTQNEQSKKINVDSSNRNGSSLKDMLMFKKNIPTGVFGCKDEGRMHPVYTLPPYRTFIGPPLESREPRNIVLSKFCSKIDRKIDVHLIACISGTLNHVDCLRYHSCFLISPVFVDCNILIGRKCPPMYRSELLMVIIELYF